MVRRFDPVPLALSSASFAVTIPFVYAALRILQRLRAPEPDPAMSQPSIAIAMFLRLSVAAYVGLLVAIGAFALARRSPARVALLLEVGLWVSALTLAVQAAVLP